MLEKLYYVQKGGKVESGMFFDGGLYVLAESGLHAIVKFCKMAGMPYNEEIVSFDVKFTDVDDFCNAVLNNDWAAEWDFARYDADKKQVVGYYSVATVVQTEFPF